MNIRNSLWAKRTKIKCFACAIAHASQHTVFYFTRDRQTKPKKNLQLNAKKNHSVALVNAYQGFISSREREKKKAASVTSKFHRQMKNTKKNKTKFNENIRVPNIEHPHNSNRHSTKKVKWHNHRRRRRITWQLAVQRQSICYFIRIQ